MPITGQKRRCGSHITVLGERRQTGRYPGSTVRISPEKWSRATNRFGVIERWVRVADTAELLALGSTSGGLSPVEIDFIPEDSWTFWRQSSAKKENSKSS